MSTEITKKRRLEECSEKASKSLCVQQNSFNSNTASVYSQTAKSSSDVAPLLTPGSHLPHVVAPAYTGGQIVPSLDLSTLTQKGLYWVCLVFYAHNFHPVDSGSVLLECYQKFQEFNALKCSMVLCSTDSCYAHLAWMKTLVRSGTIRDPVIPMLSDTSHAVSRACGVLDPATGTARKALILIDPSLTVQKVIVSGPEFDVSVDAVLESLRTLQEQMVQCRPRHRVLGTVVVRAFKLPSRGSAVTAGIASLQRFWNSLLKYFTRSAMTQLTGYTIVKLTPRQEKNDKLFTGHLRGAHTLQPGGWYFPTAQKTYFQQLKDFQFEENDVLIMTMPKSGTTWTQELVWTMKKNPNLDNPAASIPLHIRSPILEADFLVDGVEELGNFKDFSKEKGADPKKGVFLNMAKAAERPRILKTHLTFDFLSDTVFTKAKVVYVIRDPRDVCISYHHHSKLFKYEGYTGNFDQYVDIFLEDSVMYGPYWSHVKSAWDRRNLPNVLVVFFEKMKKNPKEETMKISKFLNVDLKEEQLEKLLKFTSFPEMKKRDDHCISKKDEDVFLNMTVAKVEGGFFRSGISGGWKNVLSKEQKDRFDVWIKKNCPDKEIIEILNNP
ncbi:Alkyl hydroperoxide reductase subunit C/ Thiol specific antioxidant [Trinorchestia longiramus]|nr:Alkyl hydroperoxide reductase subunit C/ Thiol specific antioxidant [Trinorchestia longiramus]